MEIDMTRHGGAIGLAVAEKIDRRDVWRVRTDIQPVYDEENTELQVGVSFIEKEFPYLPPMEEVKEFCLGVIDAETDAKILNGYEWEVLHGDDAGSTVKVWLSAENQENFKAKHDLALAYPQLTTWPVIYKISEHADKSPVYEHFANIEELAQFYLGGVAYIEQTLQEGWQKKGAFDFTPYELILNPVTENEPDENV